MSRERGSETVATTTTMLFCVVELAVALFMAPALDRFPPELTWVWVAFLLGFGIWHGVTANWRAFLMLVAFAVVTLMIVVKADVESPKAHRQLQVLVYLDANDNSKKEPGETSLSGRSVTLEDLSRRTVEVASTDAQGIASFERPTLPDSFSISVDGIVSLRTKQSGSAVEVGISGSRHVVLGSGQANGVYNSFGRGLGIVANQWLPEVAIEVLVTQGSVENLTLLRSGAIDMAIVQADVFYQDVRSGKIRDGSAEQIAIVASLFEEPMHVITVRPMDHLEDLRDLVVSVGPERGGSQYATNRVLNGLSITPRRVVNEGFVGGLSRLGDANDSVAIDAMIFWRAVPAPQIASLIEAQALHLVSLSDQHIQRIEGLWSDYRGTRIAGAVYGAAGDARTLSTTALLVARRSVERTVVRQLAKTLFEHAAEIADRGHECAATISIHGTRAINKVFLHEGAAEILAETASGR